MLLRFALYASAVPVGLDGDGALIADHVVERVREQTSQTASNRSCRLAYPQQASRTTIVFPDLPNHPTGEVTAVRPLVRCLWQDALLAL
jgi:hypothetical protein